MQMKKKFLSRMDLLFLLSLSSEDCTRCWQPTFRLSGLLSVHAEGEKKDEELSPHEDLDELDAAHCSRGHRACPDASSRHRRVIVRRSLADFQFETKHEHI